MIENKRKQKIDKYLDLTRELKKLLKMKVALVPIVVGALGIFPKGFEKTGGIVKKGKIVTIHITA